MSLFNAAGFDLWQKYANLEEPCLEFGLVICAQASATVLSSHPEKICFTFSCFSNPLYSALWDRDTQDLAKLPIC